LSSSIAIIELYQHDEVLRHYCELLQDSDYNIKIFCSKIVYECLADFRMANRFEWEVQQEEESITRFLSRHQQNFKHYNLLFVTTALSDFKAFYRLAKLQKTMLLVHNAHSFLAPQGFISFQNVVLDQLRLWKLKGQRAHFYKSKLLNALAVLAFPNEKILDYVKMTFELPADLKLTSLPFAYFRSKAQQSRNKITISIPGTVSNKLRDYDTVLAAFSQLEMQKLPPLRLVLLGRPKGDGQTILTAFQQLPLAELELITFDQFIPPKAFENWLLSTDFLILPFKTVNRNHIYREWMGYSKISGMYNDMIRYGLPALVTEEYPLEEEIQKITATYRTGEDLATKIVHWIETELYFKKRKDTAKLLVNYELTPCRNDFLSKINSILDVK